MSGEGSGLTDRLITAALCLAAGTLAALAHPPFGFWPGFLGYALLLLQVDGAEGRGRLFAAFGAGWLAGLVYFLIGCWWVAEAFAVFPEVAWMGPFAAILMGGGLALFWGFACMVYKLIAPNSLARPVVFAAVFSAFEWLRGHIFTGFPWNLPGEAWTAGSPPSQAAALVGAYGLTFITLFAWAAFAPLLQAGNRKRRVGVAVLGALTLALLWAGGAARLMQARAQNSRTIVRVVQPDVDQEAKWSRAGFQRVVARYVNLTARPGDLDPDVVIWPEGALPVTLEDQRAIGVDQAIASALRPGQVLLMGTTRSEPGGPKGPVRYYNSLAAVVRDGQGLKTLAVYDKHRLVPFGEFMPMKTLVASLGIKALSQWNEGFTPGPEVKPLDVPGVPRVQPLICYESLFPGLAGDGRGRPAWIVNISNDAWFGPTSGPKQHLNLAAYRAIEQGLPVVRATPNGVSAIIDPWGRTGKTMRLDRGASGVIDAHLPQPAGVTLYSRIGDLGFAALLLLGMLFTLKIRAKRETNSPSEDYVLQGDSEGQELSSRNP